MLQVFLTCCFAMLSTWDLPLARVSRVRVAGRPESPPKPTVQLFQIKQEPDHSHLAEHAFEQNTRVRGVRAQGLQRDLDFFESPPTYKKENALVATHHGSH